MRKRSTTRAKNPTAAEEYLKTPPSAAAEPSPNLSGTKSPAPFEFKFSAFKAASLTPSPSLSKKRLAAKISSPVRSPKSPVSIRGCKSVADLKDFASTRLNCIKELLDSSHSEILKEFEASNSRFHKRIKFQTQACQQMSDELEREHKKMSEKINEGKEAMKASYAEFMAEVQASASRMSKTTIPEFRQSVEKSIDSIRSRFGIPSTMLR